MQGHEQTITTCVTCVLRDVNRQYAALKFAENPGIGKIDWSKRAFVSDFSEEIFQNLLTDNTNNKNSSKKKD